MFLLDEVFWYWFVPLCIVGPILILMVIATIIAIVKRSKVIKNSKGVKVVLDDKTDIFAPLFGEDNIISVEQEMSRVTVEVKDLNKVDAEGLKENGAGGILFVGKKVKCTFAGNAKEVAEELKGHIK